METTTQEVHFSVEPGFYEHHARSLMLEDNWRGALAFLMETLDGMTLDAAVQVLSGTSSLKTDGTGLELVPQDPKDEKYLYFRGTYDWQHAGFWKIGSEFYQPYAHIEQFERCDEQYARSKMLEDEEREFTPTEYLELRARYYAHSRENDMVHFDEQHGAVLFKRVTGPAFWHKAFDEPSKAVEAFKKQRRLEWMGAREDVASPEGNPLHWKFYVPALEQLQLRMPRWGEKMLSSDARGVLERLYELQTKIQEAKWAEDSGKKLGRGEVDEDTGLPSLSLEQLTDMFETAVYREEILERANTCGGFLTLTLHDYDDTVESVEVPAIPLIRWASRNIPGFSTTDVPFWRPVCPQGLKMGGDNPMHTDWWVGAGYEPRNAYNQEHPLNKAAWNFSLQLAETHGCDFVKLAGKGRAFGRVVFPKPNESVPEGSIAVVPTAGVDYELAMLSACKGGRGAVISQAGGKLAHLATVARETESRVVVVDSAMSVFQEGEFVSLDLDKMKLVRHKTVFARYGRDDD